MHIRSSLPKAEYLSALKAHTDSHFRFGAERCTTLIFGPLIFVTYHSGQSWRQRLTNKDCTAFGIVQRNANGSDVHYFIVSGILRPFQFLLSLFLCTILWLVLLYQSRNWSIDTALCSIPFSLALTIILSLIEAANENLYNRRQKGTKILRYILQDPFDSIGYLSNLSDTN